MKSLLLFVRARSGPGFDAFRIDAGGLSSLGCVTTDNVLPVVGGQRPDAVAVCSPLDPDAHQLVQFLSEWTEAGRFPLLSLWSSGGVTVDPFKTYETVWGLLQGNAAA
jgi:hypothetical protein